MAGTRFPWSRAGKDNCIIELKRRSVIRTLYKDSDLICLACGRKPKDRQEVYYPAEGYNQDSKVIAHKDCVDSRYAELTAKSAGERTKAALAKTHVPMEAAPSPAVVKPAATVAAVPAPRLLNGSSGGGFDRSHWLKGWHDGVMFALDKRMPELEHDEAWLEGFHEGVSFGFAHKQAS